MALSFETFTRLFRIHQVNAVITETFFSNACQPEVDFLHSLAVVLPKKFGQIVSIRVKKSSNTNLVASRHIKRGKASISG